MNLQIETTSKCGLECVECPHRLMLRGKVNMSESVFQAILDKIIPNLKNEEERLGYPPTIICHKDGEPLLNPRLRDYIQRIANTHPEFRLNLYTNGLLLTEDFINFLDALPMKVWLLISFHFYNADGKRNDYSKIEDLMTLILNSVKPYKNIDFIFTSHVTRFMTKVELQLWEKIWKSKVPEGRVTIGLNDCINPWTGLIKEDNCAHFDACPYADFGHIFIGATGNVVSCCMDLEEKLIFGNVLFDSVEDIFGRLDRFYSRLRAKELIPNLCRKCMGQNE
jgi:MoaA/NifB/PqqE/SkfB family radical SAM enzyme